MAATHGDGHEAADPLFAGPFTEPPAAPHEFSDMPHEGSPETPGRVRPDIALVRDFFNDKLVMPDGKEVEFWAFEDERGRRTFPSPTIRVREGQIVHTTLKSSKNAHTIHHHGIETDDYNDGVGHTSFEVTGDYTYQWRAAQAGTYLYHCHVNTTLHFEMGMWGALIVDPPEGPGRAFRDGPRYDVEAVWAAGGVDPDKHELNHAAGQDGDDVGLNLWNPRYFHITGAFHPDSLTSPRAAVTAGPGQTILARIINAGYFPQRWTFGGLEAELIASDGRPFGTFESDGPPFSIPNPQSFRASELLVGSAERYDCLLRPTAPGRYVVRVEHLDWITGEPVGIAETTITVSGERQPPPEPEAGAGAGGSPSSAPPAHGADSTGGHERTPPKRRFRLKRRRKPERGRAVRPRTDKPRRRRLRKR
jgi:FtsP/CotA-like multicopper oxidase with cupredoxin domain